MNLMKKIKRTFVGDDDSSQEINSLSNIPSKETTEVTEEQHKKISDYKIIKDEKLGEGAFSSVKTCIDKETGEKYAIKIIPEKKLNEHEKQLLQQEIHVLKNTKSHKNVINSEAIFKTPKRIYMIMEICDGGDLFDYIASKVSDDKKTFKFNEAKSANILLQIANSLHYCHSKGIIHRDLKPENILFKDKNKSEVKLIDFGLSSVNNNEYEKMDTKCGTPNYVAPEVLTNDVYNKNVDWWSLGCVLHLMLTGRYAFQNENTQKLYNQIINKEIKFNKSYWKPISKEAKDLVSGLLKKNPKERFAYHNIIEHPWIKKYCKDMLDNLEEDDDDYESTSIELQNDNQYKKHNTNDMMNKNDKDNNNNLSSSSKEADVVQIN